MELDRAPFRGAHPVEGDDAVRVAELPRELRPGHVDDEVRGARGGGGDVLDPGELREDEGCDHEQDHDRPERPRELEARRAVDLRAVRVARPIPAPVADDERDQQALDEHEDREAEDRDEQVALMDPVRVRGLRWDGSEAAVPREGRRGEQSRRDRGAGEGEEAG